LVRGPEEETALRRPRPGQVDNIKMDQHEEGRERGWVDLAFLGQVV